MFAILLIVSITVSVIAYFIFKMDLKVAGITAAASFVLTLAACSIATYVSTSSTEKLNGEVTGKEQVTVSCEHSYQCHCRTVSSGSGKNKTYSTVCDTCYEHFHDYDWDVHTNVGTITIDRVDRQGVDEPQRWSIVKNGDPVAVDHTYTNWIKPAHDSLFHTKTQDDKQLASLPKYPGQIYDYYKLNRIVLDGVTVPNLDQMNEYLSEKLKVVGPKKQANIIIVVTNKPSVSFATDVYAAWQGAEKNDIVVFVSLNGNQIRWVDVEAWSKSSIFQVKLRDAINDTKTFDMKTVIDLSAQNTIQYYQRKPMKEFEYLKDDIQTITPLAAFIIFILIMMVHGGGIWFERNQLKPSRRY